MKKTILLIVEILSVFVLLGCTASGDFMTNGSSQSNPLYIQPASGSVALFTLNQTDVTGWTGLLADAQHPITSEIYDYLTGTTFTDTFALNMNVSNKGFEIVNTNSAQYGAQLYFRSNSPSPANLDEVGTFYAWGRDSLLNEQRYAKEVFTAVNVQAGNATGQIDWYITDEGVLNHAAYLAADGSLHLDAGSSTFDDYDDVMLLKRAFSNGEKSALREIGVLTTEINWETGVWNDYIDTSKLLALLAGGVYQNRDRINELESRINELEKGGK